VAIDVVYDHFLIVHWQRFSKQPLCDFKYTSYQLLNYRIPVMPTRMLHVVTSMTKNDWFKEYEIINGVGLALDNIVKRIWFTNNFAGSVGGRFVYLLPILTLLNQFKGLNQTLATLKTLM